mmetsp:Transcript_1070/g.2359  ORF Transcript_1070/g.2359 Transcript_1070/m.2359 type:complete len:333 (+) Transcript_1070:87-1085(+)
MLALKQLIKPTCAVRSAAIAVVGGGVHCRPFGRHPKNYPPPQRPDVEVPSVKDLTGHIVKTPKVYNWIRQPFQHDPSDDKETARRKRQLYVFQRTLPAPVPSAVLHGSHTTLGPENTFRRWWIADASEKNLGRLAQDIAHVIMGKHKPIYDKSLVLGDFVVVVNAEKVRMTGKKRTQKKYTHHTGFIGNLKHTPVERLLERKPIEVIRRAVHGMLPKNKLRDERLKLLRLFAGPAHPHTAEVLDPLPEFKREIRSPWVPPRAEIKPKESRIEIFTMDGKPMPELVNNLGDQISEEEAQRMVDEGNVTIRDESLNAAAQKVEMPKVDWDWEKK